MALIPTLQNLTISSDSFFQSVTLDNVNVEYISGEQMEVVELPGYIQDGDKYLGKGHQKNFIGNSGWKFKIIGKLYEDYQMKLEILNKILDSRNGFWIKMPQSAFTPSRTSVVNPDLLTIKGFYVMTIENHNNQFNDNIRGEITINFVVGEIKYINKSKISFLNTIDKIISQATNIFLDISLYSEYITSTLDNINNEFQAKMDILKNIGDDIATPVNKINQSITIIKNIPNDVNQIINQYKIIGNSFKLLCNNLTSKNRNQTNIKQSQQIVKRELKKMSLYNKDITIKNNITTEGYVDVNTTKANIMKGKETLFINVIGYINLLNLINTYSFETKTELNEFKKEIMDIKDYLFNNEKFNGIQNSENSISDSLTKNVNDIELLDAINKLYFEFINYFNLIEKSLINKSVILNKDTIAWKVIYAYYYNILSISQLTLEQIINKFLIANKIISPNDILKKENIIYLP